VKFYPIKKGHFYKGISKDSYNIKKIDGKKNDDNNLLNTLKNHSQFQKCGILKLWKFKICTLENLEFKNFKSVLPHIMG